MAFGDGERQLIVVFNLVGLKDDRARSCPRLLPPLVKCARPGRAASDSAKHRADHGEGRAFAQHPVVQVGGNLPSAVFKPKGVASRWYRAKTFGNCTKWESRQCHPSSR